VLLAPLLRRLAPPERQLLHLRFFEELSQTEIARRLGVPQSQVSRRLADLLGRMRGDIGALEAA
jgi:RNA polymerase sigma factor (sigma-70 family)